MAQPREQFLQPLAEGCRSRDVSIGDVPEQRGRRRAGGREHVRPGAVRGCGAHSLDYPPNVVVLLSKLTGAVDLDRILALAPGEVHGLTGYAPYGSPRTEMLAGCRAHRIGATYDLDGTPTIVGQSTIVVPGRGGESYLAQVSVTGTRSQEDGVEAAVQAIDRGLRIRAQG